MKGHTHTYHWKSGTPQNSVPGHGHKGILILHHETSQHIGNIQFPRIFPPKLKQLPKTHAHLKAIMPKPPNQKVTGRMG